MSRKVGKVGESLKEEFKDLKQEEKQERLEEAVADLMQVAEEQNLVFVLPSRASWG